MEAFRRLEGVAAALPRPNLDTDQLMPKQFLKGVDRDGLADGFLHDLRFDADARPRPDFVLNQAPWREASILVTGPNFGCGSSREHAVWGMRALGIRCVLGSSFGGIFAENCARNGVPAIVLADADVATLMALADDPRCCVLTVDLPGKQICAATGERFSFDMDALRRQMLMEGLDAVDLALRHTQDIRQFEARHHRDQSWLA